ncbi:retrovirus-related Pol polyprotein from transposon 297 [Trichonephila clavipes]|nr:retrovirus-related Pol polyprotein from transposon 297 [Trichonephila clavipes]
MGADISVIRANKQRNNKVSDFTLFATNGSKINTFGIEMPKLDLGLRRQFTWSFIIANVSKAIIGADFVKKFKLLVDLKRKCLIDPLTSLSSFCKIVTIPNFSLTTIVSSGYDSSIAKLLSEFKEITFNNSFIKEPKHLVTHHIDAGLVIKIAKCQFLQIEVDFLGYPISVNGIEPSKEKIKVIEDFKLPETVKELRSYLGIINFYHRFIPNAAENQAVLNNYLKGRKSNDKNKVHWTEESVQAFESSKQQLCKVTVLVHPSENAHISLMVDASDNGIGAVLQQLEHGVWKPLSFFSRKLTDAQKRYSTFDRQLLAAYSSVKYFKHFLEGRNFTIITDHKPLIYAFCQKLDKATPRQQRHLEYIAQYTVGCSVRTWKRQHHC